MQEFEFRARELAVVEPQAQMLSEANSCPLAEQIAFQRQVASKKIVANQRDALW